MTERDRWQLWVGFLVISVMLGLTGLAVAVASLSKIGLVADLAFIALVVVVIVVVRLRARRQPGFLVPPPLQGLDADSQRLVARAVRAGERAPRPELAGAVVTQARRTTVANALLLAAWSLLTVTRVAALAGGDSGSRAAVDVAVILGLLLAAAASLPAFLRARRARAANSRS